MPRDSSKYGKRSDPEYGKKWYQANKDKVKAATAKWKANHPEVYRLTNIKRSLKRDYGITLEQRDAMVLSQDNKCKLCYKEFKTTPHVDHDHVTKRIRGMLCAHCNASLGWFENRRAIIEEYLNE